jgi:sigma-70-like protein
MNTTTVASRHNPNGGAQLNLDNARIESLIAQYQSTRDIETLSSIVALTHDRALTMIRFLRTSRYRTEAELISDINFKLLRAVDKFDPARGTAFTFVSKVVKNTLCTSVTSARKSSKQYVKLHPSIVRQLETKDEDRSATDDIAHRIRVSAKTTLSDPRETAAQRWYIESFMAQGFQSRRHECANAAMAVHNLSHARSRELYDLTMLEVRRVLYGDLKRRENIVAGRLLGTRLAWMARYRPLLSDDEFTKFVVLMRDLAPYLLLIIDPRNRNSHRHDRIAVTRETLDLILNGDRDAVPLYRMSISDGKDAINCNSE